MGASLSMFASENPSQLKTGLGDLPEGCIASVLLHLTPPEICRLAKLNWAFRGATAADFVWESKLPDNYRDLFKELCNGDPDKSAKKEIYAQLCASHRFDSGHKVAWLDKVTGGICLSIGSKALSITGIDDRRYWKYITTNESRFCSVAYLQQTWWFEVGGEIDFHIPVGMYSLFFRLHLGQAFRRLGRRLCNSEHIHGWNVKPVHFQLSTSDGQHARSQCHLDAPGKWVYYHVGGFVVHTRSPTKLKFCMTQIDCTHTKGGLCVDSVLICPSQLRERLKMSGEL